MAARLMIDPSLLIDQDTFPDVSATVAEEQVWVSRALYTALTDGAPANRRNRLRLSEWVGQSEVDPQVVARLLANPNVVPYEGQDIEGTNVTYDSFLQVTDDPFIASVLFDEWSFLLSESWIAAKAKRTFSAFQSVGGHSVEITVDAFDILVRRTLKQQVPKPLTIGQRLRASTKWIAGGGTVVAPLLGPIGVGLGAGLAIFLIVDP